jgi:hypothetical protein
MKFLAAALCVVTVACLGDVAQAINCYVCASNCAASTYSMSCPLDACMTVTNGGVTVQSCGSTGLGIAVGCKTVSTVTSCLCTTDLCNTVGGGSGSGGKSSAPAAPPAFSRLALGLTAAFTGLFIAARR